MGITTKCKNGWADRAKFHMWGYIGPKSILRVWGCPCRVTLTLKLVTLTYIENGWAVQAKFSYLGVHWPNANFQLIEVSVLCDLEMFT